MVPTAILTLNWAEAASQAHNLDKQLKPIVAKSKEGFIFNIDLQVQIHVSDKLAPKVISMPSGLTPRQPSTSCRNWSRAGAASCLTSW